LRLELKSSNIFGLTLEDIERLAILEALRRNNWRRMATARELGIDKNTLRRKMIRFSLKSLEPSGTGAF
jgi:transcriptional regulator of acetoin/glycerol metabolism